MYCRVIACDFDRTGATDRRPAPGPNRAPRLMRAALNGSEG